MIRMTSQVIVWLVVVVSLCMHACSARYLLSLIHDHTESAGSKQQLQYPPKVQKVMEDVSLATQGGDQTWVGAVIITAIKKHTLVFKEQSSTAAAAGEARLIAHTRDGLQQQEGRNDNLVKGIMRKRRGRALTMAEMNEKMEEKEGSSNSHHHDEAAEETTSSTDVVVMDYAQPHRKPPIHNEKA